MGLCNYLSGWLQIIALLIPLVSVGSAVGQSLDARKIAEQYARSYDWCKKVALTLQVEAPDYGADDSMKSSLVLFNVAGNRFYQRGDITVTNNRNGTSDHVAFQYSYDETLHQLLQQRGTPETGASRVSIYEDSASTGERERCRYQRGGPIFGFFESFSAKSIPDLFTNAEKVTCREENYKGEALIALETEVPEGHVAVWVDPRQSYSLRHCRLIKEAGQHVNSDGTLYAPENNTVKSMLIEFTAEQTPINGVYCPTNAVMSGGTESADGSAWLQEMRFTVNGIELNPKPDDYQFVVPDGTEVAYKRADGTQLSGFMWQSGKVVAQVDDTVLSTVKNNVVRLSQGEPALAPNAQAQVTPDLSILEQRADKPEPLSRNVRIYVIMTVVALALLSLTLILRRVTRDS